MARSLRTLVVRVRAQNAAALAVARAMEGHPPVARVLYPGLESESFDLIVSNCVINLSPDKPGGELYFSNVYADRRVPPELAADPVLYGECLAGALYWNVTVQTPPTPTLPHEGEGGKESAPYVLGTPGGWRESEWLHWNDFLHLTRNAGFTDQRRVEDRPIGIADPLIEERVAPTRFYSATYRLFKLPGLEHDCEDYGQAVAYRGTLPRHPGAWSLDKHHRFPTDKVAPVCGNTQRMLYETRFRPHFDFFGDGGQHLGLFEDCGGGLPFTAGGDGQTATCC